MTFFKTGDVVTIDHGTIRYQVLKVGEGYQREELVAIARVRDVDGNERDVVTERLTKVAG